MALADLLPLEQGSASLLSAVTVSGVKYDIRDYAARNALSSSLSVIDQLSTMAIGGVHYIGRAADSDNITDGSTLSVVHIGSTSVEVQQGDMVTHKNPSTSGGQDCEFIWNGSAWYELGSTGSLKALAFKDNATGNWSQTTNTNEASPEVSFANATFTGNEDTISATFNGVAVEIPAGFSGTLTTLTANVATTDTNLTVQLSNANVTAVTGLASHDAIKNVPDLTVTTDTTTVDFGGNGISYETNAFTRLTAATTSSLNVGTAWAGSTTTFSGSYTPSGNISGNVSCITNVTNGSLGVTPVTATPDLALNSPVVDSTFNITSITEIVTVTGTVTADTGTIATGNITGINSLKATGDVSKPDVTFTPSSHSFLSSATVTNEVLSFDGGNALTSGSAALASAPTFSGTGCAGSLTFSGTGFSGGNFTLNNGSLNGTGTVDVVGELTGSGINGTIGIVGGALTGNVEVTCGKKELIDTKFTGTAATINTSGTPLGTLTKTALDYVVSTASSNDAVTVTGCGTVEVGPYATNVAYSGAPEKATITLSSGKLSVTGTQTLTYKKPTTVSIEYTPSGELTTTGYTPTGTVIGKVKATGSISGTQTLTHKHGVTVGGTVTVS